MSGFVLALLLASAAAFAVAERLKLERSPVAAPDLERVIGPVCECDKAEGTLSVRFREPVVVTASVVNADDDAVRVLGERERHPRGRVTWTWDGRGDDGEVVADGLYRLRLELVDRDRAITVPTPVRIDTRPPRVRLLEAGPTTITPDDNASGPHQIRYSYVSTEFSNARVEVDGELLFRGLFRPAGERRVRWRGRKDGGPAPPGVYRTVLFVVDRAGNRSNPTRPVEVRILPVGG
jgi:FlgD Ig-like domain